MTEVKSQMSRKDLQTPPPPPAPSSNKNTSAALVSQALKQSPSSNQPPFLVTGETTDDTTFEFTDTGSQQGAVSLKAIIRQYVGSAGVKSVPCKNLYMILGRLRCLNFAIKKYNEGLVSQSAAFTMYWRKRVLNQLSGWGFQLQNPTQPISIIGLGELVVAIEELYKTEIQDARDMIRGGQIVFDGLGELYRPDTPVQGKTTLGGTQAVFMVTESFYEEHRALIGMEKSFHWTMEFVVTMGEHFTVVAFTEVLSGWTGVRTRPVSELTYTPVNPADYEKVLQRGRKYIKFGSVASQFVQYTPNSFYIHSTSSARGGVAKAGGLVHSGGRVMIDPGRGFQLGHHASQGADEPTQAMIQMAGRYRRWQNTQAGGGGSGASDGLNLWDKVPDEFLMYCWPALVGFSFSAKAWGHILVSGLEEIKFYDKAFDQLVLAPEKKQLIRALVKFGGEKDTDDIVGGKTGGCVFLLHGKPGVGKTLTAEAISEVLRRPLYYVSMGELGLTPEEMEKRLGDVLELCAGWNALTILDEADVFLEQRSTSDIVRNAMVCVMLRLVEYHPGILFLTTNRVQKFDPAFESRVTIALKYDSLTPDARAQVWKNLITKVSIPVDKEIKFEQLAQHDLNGRQIKNAVRLAVALARERQTSVTQSILETTLDITSLGRREMKEDDTWKE